MKMLLMLILCSCATEQKRFIRTITTTTTYPAPVVQPVAIPLGMSNPPSYTSQAPDYDFTDIDDEIEQEDNQVDEVIHESVMPDLMPEDTVRYDGEVTLGKTVVKR